METIVKEKMWKTNINNNNNKNNKIIKYNKITPAKHFNNYHHISIIVLQQYESRDATPTKRDIFQNRFEK